MLAYRFLSSYSLRDEVTRDALVNGDVAHLDAALPMCVPSTIRDTTSDTAPSQNMNRGCAPNPRMPPYAIEKNASDHAILSKIIHTSLLTSPSPCPGLAP